MTASDHGPPPERPQAPARRPTDVWTDGAAYERYVGRWSQLVAREFLAWLAVAPGSRWLDIGCGTGMLSRAILQDCEPAAVMGIDRAEGYLAFAREQAQDTRVRFAVQDVQALADDAAAYDAVVSGLVLNFLPQPDVAIGHMVRGARPGGVVAAYVWDYAGSMQLMRHFWDAAAALDPQASSLHEGRRFPICQPQPLADLFRAAGLAQVEVRAIEITTNFQDFDDYWLPFLGGQGPAPSYVQMLSDEQRAALRERLRQSLPIAQDGSIALVARAWAVRGARQPL
jgi:trans-aconitate methyltransferase